MTRTGNVLKRLPRQSGFRHGSKIMLGKIDMELNDAILRKLRQIAFRCFSLEMASV